MMGDLMPDPVHDLAHDHADLNRRVLEIGERIRGLEQDGATALAAPLTELRELLFLHFAREEEGLFPFITDNVRPLAEQVHGMAVAHDTICGALARMCHLAASGGEPSTIASLFERFEHAYATHARTEAALLAKLDGILDARQRAKLAALVDGL